MCGRFTLTVPPELIADLYDLEVPLAYRPRFNIAPTQPVAVIANRAERAVELFRWGLIPRWAKDAKIASRLINARSETLAEKPSFKQAYQRRRCLVLADGFYEWRKRGKVRIPQRFVLRGREPFAFAGLWESWSPPGGDEIHSCTIITTAANVLVAPVHDRMPVILPRDAHDAWLDPEPRAPETLRDLLHPYPSAEMESYEVSTAVNSVRADGPECIAPAGQLGLGLG
jgi:putative SOS response-associated peptidase YedK